MIKKDIIKKISNDYGITEYDTSLIVQAVLENLIDGIIKDGKVELRKFGTFKIIERKARVAYDPRNREKLSVPSKKVVKFIMSKRIKEKLK